VSIDSSVPGIVILKDVFARGWVSTIDGVSVPVIRVNGLVLGTPVPAGRHIVEFVYQPQAFRLGLLTAIAAAVYLLVATYWRSYPISRLPYWARWGGAALMIGIIATATGTYFG
jgi:uncharacterized membrane protein YfhO